MGKPRGAVFHKLLIANRGEIACRVMRTARAMEIATVAVHSEADADALHVELADEAYAIGPATAAESYLRGGAIIEVARACGADAIHPGYGFLAENAGFARACAEAAIAFVGPSPETIEAMGDKAAAKALMVTAGVPVVAGYSAGQGDKALSGAATRLGFPLLIKPVVGGGGTGMRVVEQAVGFSKALAAARREAMSAFGDERVLLERYLERPRHIEVQVFGDAHGNVIHLFERDCSVQRRHQKVIEEAPAPGLAEGLRAALLEAAVAAARAVGYQGAGTVEFLVDADGEFYFLEMNTRLQVEHPVTEMITGLDLVEWQLRVAAGEALPREQGDVAAQGHAIEARIYAEDPGRGFLPSTGTLYHFSAGAERNDTRLESGVRQGDAVGPHYDPMIAKLVVWGEDRAAAVARLRQSLAALQIAGVANNLAFLAAIAAHPDFAAGALDTGFIGRHLEALTPPPPPAPDAVLALASIDAVARRAARAAESARRTRDPHSPWHRADGWRLNRAARHDFRFLDGDDERRVWLTPAGDGTRVEVDGVAFDAVVERGEGGELTLRWGGDCIAGVVAAADHEVTVFSGGVAYRLVVHDPLALAGDEAAADGRLSAPMPGRIVQVMVEAGARVARGAPLLVLEAMKMEHTITAPADGLVERVNYAAGDLVEEGAELIEFVTQGDG